MSIAKWIGVFIEVTGAFLLAAEAIKAENLESLRKALAGAARTLLMVGRTLGVSAAGSGGLPLWLKDWLWVLAGLTLFLALGAISYLFEDPDKRQISSIFMWMFWIGPVGAVIIGWTFSWAVTCVMWINKNMKQGSVGILGFICYFVSVIIREIVEGRVP